MKFSSPAPLCRLLCWVGCAALLLSACKIDPEAAVRISARMEATRQASLPSPTPLPPNPFLAMCIVKSTTRLNLRQAPDQAAASVATVANRDVLSVTLRSEDAKWVYATTVKRVDGWVLAASLGCTVPVEEMVFPTRTPSVASIAAQTAEALLPTQTRAPASPTPTQAATLPPTATPLVLTPTGTPIPPTNTPAPPTELNCTVVITNGLNVRRGPGTTFPAFIKLDVGETFVAVGRSEDGFWLGGRVPSVNRQGWVIAASVFCFGSIAGLPTLPNNALPADVPAPTVTIVPTETPAAAPTETSPTATATELPTTVPTEVALTPTPILTLAPSTPTATAAATATPLPTPLPAIANGIQCTVFVTTGVNVRSGPARTFAVLGVARTGEKFVASGRNANNQWLFGTSDGGFTGWVVAGGTRCAKPIRTLPVTKTQPAPAKPKATPTPTG
jgi:uncharacterized protein YgiM (DUF1202 family)